MRAVYEIYSAVTGVVVDHVTLDVYGDPHEFTIRYEAVDMAGHEPSAYTARFIGYEGRTASVPFEAIEAIAALVNDTPQALDEGRLSELRDMLIGAGCLKREGFYVNPVKPE